MRLPSFPPSPPSSSANADAYVNADYVGGFLGATLHGLEVVCTPADLAVFDPPPGQTCGAYAGAWVASSGGYLVDAAATAGCGFCAYSSGDQYLTTLDIRYEDRWRDFGIFLAYVVFNAFLAYVRVPLLVVCVGAMLMIWMAVLLLHVPRAPGVGVGVAARAVPAGTSC